MSKGDKGYANGFGINPEGLEALHRSGSAPTEAA